MSSGCRVRESHVAVAGFTILLFICFTSYFYLPNTDETLLSFNEYRPGQRHVNVVRDQRALYERMEKANIPPPPLPDTVNVERTEDTATADGRRKKVREMMKFAWDGYRRYAWGDNELNPISKKGHSQSVFGGGKIGATIVDALDTLWIMDLKEEFNDAKKWIELTMDLKKDVRGDLSVFETNIRFVGGLLSAYALTKDEMLLKKAEQIGRMLLPAFESPTGIPFSLINLQTGRVMNYNWAAGGCSILAEYGSLQMEFDYLSNLTGDPIFSEKIEKVNTFLDGMEKPDGLVPVYINPHSGKWGAREFTIGALADSYYEYLLKTWLIESKRNVKSKKRYDDVMDAMEKKMLYTSKKDKLQYFAILKGNRVEHKMEHLGCFSAGMFALQATNEVDTEKRAHYMRLGENIAHTCHESYVRTQTGLGPEAFTFMNENEEAKTTRDKYYIQRPEVVEGWFYLWRITRNEKYREWAWSVVESIDRYCRVEAGFSGIRDVYSLPVVHDDVQQSFLLAETFKYLYLIFDDAALPLNQWVFNTEAHPFPVRA